MPPITSFFKPRNGTASSPGESPPNPTSTATAKTTVKTTVKTATVAAAENTTSATSATTSATANIAPTSTTDATSTAPDSKAPKPQCKYGAKCFRQSRAHRTQYAHPENDGVTQAQSSAAVATDVEGATPKVNTAVDGTASKRKHIQRATPANSKRRKALVGHPDVEFEFDVASYPPKTPPAEILAMDPAQRAAHWRKHLAARYQLSFPSDFFDLWDWVSELQPEDPCGALVRLVRFFSSSVLYPFLSCL